MHRVLRKFLVHADASACATHPSHGLHVVFRARTWPVPPSARSVKQRQDSHNALDDSRIRHGRRLCVTAWFTCTHVFVPRVSGRLRAKLKSDTNNDAQHVKSIDPKCHTSTTKWSHDEFKKIMSLRQISTLPMLRHLHSSPL